MYFSGPPVFPIGYVFATGTTGRPKGVTISHSSLVVQSLAKIAIVGYSEDDVCLFPWKNYMLVHTTSQGDAVEVEKSLIGRWLCIAW